MGTLSETGGSETEAQRRVRARVHEGVKRVSSSSPFSNSECEEKSLREWAEELLNNALAEDRKKEARENWTMG